MSECVCCDATVSEGRQVCLICEKNLKLLKELRKEGKEREMRRIDKLRAMSVEDVAKMIFYSSYLADYCFSDCNIPYRDITDDDCLACVVKWLNEKIEIKEGEVN